ncbi:MAG: META domain-containing protein [Betaproteobacteria bacterium]
MHRLFVLAVTLLLAACANPASGQAAASPGGAPAALTSAPEGAALIGVVWSWQRELTGKEPPDPPELFTVEFLPGGKFTAHIDCNNGGGSWMVDESKLRMTSVRIPKMMCPPGWKDRLLTGGLEGAQTWAVRNGELVITTRGEVGTLRFRPLRK